MNNWIIAIAILGQSLAWGASVSRDDYELQIKLESQFDQKIRQAFPQLRFVLLVDMRERKSVQLDLIDGEAKITDVNEPVFNSIERVRVLAEQEISVDSLSDVLNFPARKIEIQKLAPLKSSTGVPMTDAAPKSWQDTMKEYLPFIHTFLIGLGAVIAALLFMAMTRIAASIVEVGKALFQQSQKRESPTDGDEPKKKPAEPAFPPARSQHSFSAQQLKAMLAECYWTEHDSGAAALIREYPNAAAYQELRFGAEYLHYLKSVPTGDLQFIHDPYFLYPVDSLQDLSVQDTPPALANQVSQMRFECLNFGATELIRAQQIGFASTKAFSKQSELRTLITPLKVKFKDVQEEEAILQSKDFDLQTKISLPSLFVLQQLPAQDLQEILGQMSVNELCEAWIGPESVLQTIEKQIPERKKRVFQEVKGTIEAGRETRGFRKLQTIGRHRYEQLQRLEAQQFKITA